MTNIHQSATAPFPIELLIFEEDRWLVLSAQSHALPERRSAKTLVGEMASAEVPAQGSLIIRGNQGLAVVHDLDRSPTWSIEVVEQLIDSIHAHCERHGLRAIGLQPLGAVHGNLGLEEFVALLEASPLRQLERIWVMT